MKNRIRELMQLASIDPQDLSVRELARIVRYSELLIEDCAKIARANGEDAPEAILEMKQLYLQEIRSIIIA